MVRMGAPHVCLAQAEVDDPVVSLPLVGGLPQRRALTGNRSDVVEKVRGPSSGRDRATHRIYTKVHSTLPRDGRFNAHIQVPKVPFQPRRGWK